MHWIEIFWLISIVWLGCGTMFVLFRIGSLNWSWGKYSDTFIGWNAWHLLLMGPYGLPVAWVMWFLTTEEKRHRTELYEWWKEKGHKV